MSKPHTFSFSKPGYGSLDLEFDRTSKQKYSSNEIFPIKLEGLGTELSTLNENIFFYEWQKIQYTYTIEEVNQFKSPFELRVKDRIEKISKNPNNGVHILSGQLSFDDEVGHTRIEIRDANNHLIFGLDTEVFPQKMDYKSDYQAMMAEISSIVQNLAYDTLKDTFRKSRARLSGHSTQNEWWNILNMLFDQLVLNIGVIKRQPKHEIRTTQKVLPIEKIKQASKRNLDWMRKNKQFSSYSEPGLRVFDNCYFSHALSSNKCISYDTYENRFIAWAIQNIIQKLKDYKLHTEQNQGNQDYSPLLKIMKNYQSRLQGILHENPFNEVGTFEKRAHFSTSLTKGAGYRDFMQIYLLLTRGLEIAKNDIFNIEQKNISTLYEYWCFLMLVKIFKEQNSSEIDYQDLIKIKAGKIKVELVKGKKSQISFKNKITNESTTLYFNREFVKDNKKIFTYNQRPDYSIKIIKTGFSKPFWYLFDAKYRFDENSRNEKDVFNVPQDAIGQLHRYRDAILHSEPNNSTYRVAIKNLGGIILYPYPLSEEKFRKENIYYQSIKDVNIGALPFLPSKTRLVNELISKLINKSPEEHYEQYIDMDRSEYDQQRNLWKEWITIGVIPKENRNERIAFLRDKLIFHIPFVTNSNSKLYMTKKLLACKSDTNEAFQYDVLSWEILSDKELNLKGTTWLHREEKYVAFTLTNETEIKTPEKIAPISFRYTTCEGFNRYLKDPKNNKWCFYLTNPDAARLCDELKKINIDFAISWANDSSDPSLININIGDIRILSSDKFPPLNFIVEGRKIILLDLINSITLYS